MVTEIATRDRLQPSLLDRLGIRVMEKKHLLAVGLAMNFIIPSAWAEHAETPITQTVFVGQQLRLVDDQGQCTLVKPDQNRMKLDMEWPCSFSLNKQQQLRVETFNDTPIFSVWRSEHMPAPSRDCLSKMQAIRKIQGAWKRERLIRMRPAARAETKKMYVGPFTW
ncbi:hypothetical protein ACFS4T_34075 [Pseudomonas lini]